MKKVYTIDCEWEMGFENMVFGSIESAKAHCQNIHWQDVDLDGVDQAIAEGHLQFIEKPFIK